MQLHKKNDFFSSEMSLTRYKVLYRIKHKNTLIFLWNHSVRIVEWQLLLKKSDRYTKKWGALYCCEYVSIHDLFAENSREKKTSLRNQMSRLGCHLEKPKDCLRAQHSTLEVLRSNQNKPNHTDIWFQFHKEVFFYTWILRKEVFCVTVTFI